MSENWINRIRRWMDQSGTSQVNLAKTLDCTRGAVGHYLTGRRQPTLSQLERIAEAMQVHPAWLLYGIGGEQIAEPKGNYRRDTSTPGHLPVTRLSADGLSERARLKLNPGPFLERCYGVQLSEDLSPYRQGDILLIDPAAASFPGDEVLLCYPQGAVYVKRLVAEVDAQLTLSELDDGNLTDSVSVKDIEYLHRVVGSLKANTLSALDTSDPQD